MCLRDKSLVPILVTGRYDWAVQCHALYDRSSRESAKGVEDCLEQKSALKVIWCVGVSTACLATGGYLFTKLKGI